MMQKSLPRLSLDTAHELIGATLISDTEVQVSQSMIDQFADATLDRQYIHIDPERAAQSPFGHTVAHGFLSLSLLPHLLESVQPIPAGVAMQLNYGLNRVRFPSAVAVDSLVRAEATLKSIDDSKPGTWLLTWEEVVRIDGETKPAVIAEFLKMWVLEQP